MTEAALPARERIDALDAVRGAALFGVLMVNLVTDFRAPLVRYLAVFHTAPGACNRAVDLAIGVALESKALAMYSLLLGVGVAIQVDRAAKPARMLARRFGSLLALGLAHLTLVWNGDILTAYALCGLLMIPLVRRGPRVVLGASLACAVVHALPWSVGAPTPQGDALSREVTAAVSAYGRGGYLAVLRYRTHETATLIAPLLARVFPRTLALALLGVQLWRSVLSAPRERRVRALRLARALGLGVGGAMTLAAAVAAERGHFLGRLASLHDLAATVPLAMGYASTVWLLAERPGWSARLAPLAALGRLSLTNYLTQSVLFSVVFYGYGLGLYGRLAPAETALLGLAVYVAQAAWSLRWHRLYGVGPVERLWRLATVGRAAGAES